MQASCNKNGKVLLLIGTIKTIVTIKNYSNYKPIKRGRISFKSEVFSLFIP